MSKLREASQRLVDCIIDTYGSTIELGCDLDKAILDTSEALAEPVATEREPIAVIKASRANFERQFGKQVFADWVYDDLTYSFENAAPAQPVSQEHVIPAFLRRPGSFGHE